MHAHELTIPAPAPARPARRRRIAAIATALTALLLAAAGGAALAANTLRDGDGYFSWPTETFGSSGYAIAIKSVDVSHAPAWAFGSAGLDRLRVDADADRPLFVGIARAGDVERYLRGSEHDDVSGLSYHPFHVDYDHAGGSAPARAPRRESFWVASTSGTDVALAWKPRPGNWRAVVMNADGSRGVTARIRLGARTSLLWWVGAGLLGAAALLAIAAAVLRARSRAAR